MLLALAVAAVEKVIGGSNPSWWPLQQAGRSSSLATGETTVTTCFRNTWAGSISISILICLRMARLMPLLLAAASAQELHGVSTLSIFSTPPLLPPHPLFFPLPTSTRQPPQPQNNFPFNFLPTRKIIFLAGQVKHVLAGSEYSAAAAAREEKALVFGDQVDEKKYTSCKPRGNDTRFLFFALIPRYLKM